MNQDKASVHKTEEEDLKKKTQMWTQNLWVNSVTF